MNMKPFLLPAHVRTSSSSKVNNVVRLRLAATGIATGLPRTATATATRTGTTTTTVPASGTITGTTVHNLQVPGPRPGPIDQSRSPYITHSSWNQHSQFCPSSNFRFHSHSHSCSHRHPHPHPRSCNSTWIESRSYYHSSSSLFKEAHGETQPSQDDDREDGDDVIPEWQNPLHHKSEEMNQMFQEDFVNPQEEMVATPLPPFEVDPEKVVAPPHVHDLAHKIVNLTLLELKELTDKIAEYFDFDDQVMAASYSGGAVASASASAGTEDDKPAEKVIFDLKLIGFDAKAKIKVIKEIRAIAGLGLKEAKELVESAPKVFQKGLKQDKADELKAQLEAVGAQVEIV